MIIAVSYALSTAIIIIYSESTEEGLVNDSWRNKKSGSFKRFMRSFLVFVYFAWIDIPAFFLKWLWEINLKKEKERKG